MAQAAHRCCAERQWWRDEYLGVASCDVAIVERLTVLRERWWQDEYLE
jgi:hypothetical protein